MVREWVCCHCLVSHRFFNHRATSQTLGSTQSVVGAQILDLNELDRKVLKLGGDIVRAKQAVGLLPATEKALPSRIPLALRNSFLVTSLIHGALLRSSEPLKL